MISRDDLSAASLPHLIGISATSRRYLGDISQVRGELARVKMSHDVLVKDVARMKVPTYLLTTYFYYLLTAHHGRGHRLNYGA